MMKRGCRTGFVLWDMFEVDVQRTDDRLVQYEDISASSTARRVRMATEAQLEKNSMMALLFGLFLVVACGVVFGEKKYILVGAYICLVGTAMWFMHHASDPLSILL